MPRGVLVMTMAPLYRMYNMAIWTVQQMFYGAADPSDPSSREYKATSEPSLIDHEVEPPGEPSRVLRRAHQQRTAEQAVGPVLLLAGEIELGGQQAAAGRLHFHVDMARAAGIDSGHDATQPVAPVRIRELMTPQAQTRIIVLALGVVLPAI